MRRNGNVWKRRRLATAMSGNGNGNVWGWTSVYMFVACNDLQNGIFANYIAQDSSSSSHCGSRTKAKVTFYCCVPGETTGVERLHVYCYLRELHFAVSQCSRCERIQPSNLSSAYAVHAAVTR